jgi:predicted acylesterase/phospholipase RssA
MKYLSLILLVIGFVFGEDQGLNQNNEYKKIALVLSGGGAQGIAHIGVLKAFEEYNIPIDFIVGTSAGAIVGGLYASGIPIKKLELMSIDGTFMKLFLGRNDLSDFPVWQRNEVSSGKFSIKRNEKQINGPPGLFNDQLIWRDLFLLTAAGNQEAKANFDSLFIPFRAIGADIVTQEMVVLGSGSLGEAIRVSMSIPMIYPAVVTDNTILIDGGIYNNMPTDVAKNLDADLIIAVNVDDLSPPVEKIKDIFDYFDLYSSVFFSPTDSVSVGDWDYFINVNTEGFHIFDFSSGEAIIKRGYDAGIKAAKKIRKNIDRQLNIRKMENRQQKFQNALNENSIKHVQWIDLISNEKLLDECKIETPFLYSSNRVYTLINSLYSTNIYDLIIPDLTEESDTLRLKVRKKSTIQMIPEIKINSVNGFNFSGDWTYSLLNNKYSLRTKAGIGNYKSNAVLTFMPNTYISPNLIFKSRFIWELKTSGNYQVYNGNNFDKEISLLKSGIGFSIHHLINWDQQLTASINLNGSYWDNFVNPYFSANNADLYSIFNLQYENNHILEKAPVFNGWNIELDAFAGYSESNIFYGFTGNTNYGLDLSEKNFIEVNFAFKEISEQTPLELSQGKNTPIAFTNSLFLDSFSSTSLDINFNIMQTVFRDDIFFSIKSYNSYLDGRTFSKENGWMTGIDISFKYESILGPIELGWSKYDEQIVSWTKLHIYL